MDDNVWESILFPSMEQYEQEQEIAKAMLRTEGYKVGDTVYLDGKVEGVIQSVSFMSEFSHTPNDLIMTVIVSGADADEHFGTDKWKDRPRVGFPCQLRTLKKERNND